MAYESMYCGEVGVLEEERKRIGNIVWRVLA